jgi:enoyl-CoA hydratase/carnithine racemase
MLLLPFSGVPRAAAARTRDVTRRGAAGGLAAAMRAVPGVSPVRHASVLADADYTELALELDADAKVLTVRFDREPRLNALSEVMGNEIHALIDQLKTAPIGDVRCVVITGKGRAFSTGRDLKESAKHAPADATRYLELAYSSANAFAELPMPTIAAINGPCFGWGLESAMACDFRMATTDAKICFPECRLGIFPGAGGVARLCKQVPMAYAKMMVLSARVLSGADAADAGLVAQETYDSPEDLVEAAQALARDIAANAPLGVREAKRMFDEIEHLPLADALEHSRGPRMALNSTEDFKEGVTAFAEKRKPVFTGA